MQTSSFKVSGPSVRELPDLLADALSVTALVKHDDVTVLCHEKYYIRVDSNLMSTIVVSQVEDQVCFVDIVTGGGKQGLLGISFGAEKRNTEIVSKVLFRVSTRLDLDVTPS